ncbi:MAG TPA: hypothetical protein VII42_02605 [Caulobacteraceae bacterium]|jgi:hypothetical protein
MATNKQGGVQGEGDYVSAKKFDDEERSFVESGRVAKKAREAADALDGPEGAELERARKASAQGKSLPKGGGDPDQVKDESDAHTERALDKGLEETFPASDPVSISPGAD